MVKAICQLSSCLKHRPQRLDEGNEVERDTFKMYQNGSIMIQGEHNDISIFKDTILRTSA